MSKLMTIEPCNKTKNLLIPKTMQAVVLRDYQGKSQSAAVAEVRVPHPQSGQVLVQIDAAPVNPADLAFMKGYYGFKKSLPTIGGFEGAGTVVAAGDDPTAQRLIGKRVACGAADPTINGGTWAQYLLTDAHHCIPLAKEVSTEQGSTLLINPLTAWGLLEQARQGEHRTVVLSAAAGAVGRMIVRLAQRFSINTINIIRRDEQEELLRNMGAQHILNEYAPDFDTTLRDLCHDLGATIGFDAVAGNMASRILLAQPNGSRLLVYGALSLKPSRIDPSWLIFQDKHLEGFWLSTWLKSKSGPDLVDISREVQKLLTSELNTTIQARVPLENFALALTTYKFHMTAGKILLKP